MITFAAVIFSIFFTVLSIQTSIRKMKFVYMGLALITCLLYPIITEFFIGLEGLRLAVIYYLNPGGKRSWQDRTKATFIHYLPYLVLLTGFVYWRLFIFSSVRPTTDMDMLTNLYKSNPLSMIVSIMAGYVRDLLNSIIMAWFIPTSIYFLTTRPIVDTVLFLLLGILISVLVWFYLRWMRKYDNNDGLRKDENDHLLKVNIWIGFFVVLCALLPIELTNRGIDLSYGQTTDRYTIVTTLGVIPLVLGLIFLLSRRKSRNTLVIGILFLSILGQYGNISFFRDGWDDQKQIWWQLAWRAPQLKDGTVLMLNPPENTRYFFGEDYVTWGPADMIYNNKPHSQIIYSQVLTTNTANELKRGLRGERFIRNIYFVFDYKNTLLISMPGSSNTCLHVIDSFRPELSLNEPALVQLAAPYSNIQQINTDAPDNLPPEIIFGPEPEHTWCYYYQKMSLSRQLGNWMQVVILGKEAMEAGFQPQDLSEWMPLIEAYTYSGDLNEAMKLLDKVRVDSALSYNLCLSVLNQKNNMDLNLTETGFIFLSHNLCSTGQ